jgi:hypothetical protein
MFVRRLAPAMGLVLVTGCSQIFGLDKPGLAERADAFPDGVLEGDRDGDNIIDDADNCPDVPNPDQVDVDGNRVGDACEGCVMLPLRATDDDDSDQQPDASDNCFGLGGMQPDADGDGIGDACDPHTGKDVRFCIWTFRPPEPPEDSAFWSTAWTLPTLNWSLQDSVLRKAQSVTIESASPNGGWFESPGGIAFDTRLALAGYTEPIAFGIELLVQAPNGDMTFTCQLAQGANASAQFQLLYNGTSQGMFNLNVAVPMTVSAYARIAAIVENGKLMVRCMFDSPLTPPINVQHDYPAIAIKARPRLFGDRASLRFDHAALYKLGI